MPGYMLTTCVLSSRLAATGVSLPWDSCTVQTDVHASQQMHQEVTGCDVLQSVALSFWPGVLADLLNLH